jgi:SulP family sulfate permease
VLTVRVDENLYVANARFLQDRVHHMAAERPQLQHVVLMCPAVNMIDASALESLKAISGRLEAAGVTFHLSEVKGPVMDALQRSDFFEHLTGRVFLPQSRRCRRSTPRRPAGRCWASPKRCCAPAE